MKKSNLYSKLFFFATFFLAIMLISKAGIGTEDPPLSQNTAKRGLQIAPVTLNLKGRNRNLVGQGSYIVNAVAGCNDCHTCPSYTSGHDPFMGQPGEINSTNYLAGGVPFGPFTSSNITPDSSGLPGGLTFDEFLTAMQTGKNIDNLPPQPPSPIPHTLLQVMPWPGFSNMTNHDLEAVYEYLLAIPHADPGTCTGASQ